MIESITIKKVATYDDVGTQINDLKKINFIYGVNGSGKTIISKFLNDQDDNGFDDCILQWKNGIPIKTLVYNKDFRDKSFGKSNIDGVFTLGQATKEEIEAIDRKQKELKEIKDNYVKKKDTLDKQEIKKEEEGENFRDQIWDDVYKKNELNFKEAFKGVMLKKKFKEKILDEFQNNTSPLLSHEELIEKAKTIFGKVPETITAIKVINFDRIIELGNDKIWQKKIVGKTDVDIAKLIQKLSMNDWVNKGRTYIQEDSICPFCQQETITDDFRKQLESYFDESFTEDIHQVQENSEEYKRLASNIINELNQIENNEKLKDNTKLELDTFSAYIKTASSQLMSNNEIINNKNNEPSRSINLISLKEQLENIKELITNANKEIEKHNVIVINYLTEKENLIKSIWKFLVEENKTNIKNFNKIIKGLQEGIKNLSKQVEDLKTDYNNLDKEIKEATKHLTSVQPSVNEINRILNSFGFKNFQIVPSATEANQYQIQREDGSLAVESLSEGEITFITFLYFLQLAKGSTSKEDITEERVLIIDDPISSLDSNVLFVVSSLLKDIIDSIRKDQGNIRQIVLLTHCLTSEESGQISVKY